MAVREGFITALGTAVVVVAGVGAAVGAHTLVGDPVAAPSPTPTVAAPSFCDVMGTIDEFYQGGAENFGLGDTAVDLSASDDPATLAAIHAQGQPEIDSSKKLGAYLRHAGSMTTNAEASDAFTTLADAVEWLGQTFGVLSLNATGVDTYASDLLDATSSPEYKTMTTNAQKAGDTVASFVLDTCGIDLKAVDPETAARNDASAVGSALETFFLDWKARDPVPVIEVRDGSYYLSTTTKADSGELTESSIIGPVSKGIGLVDQAITNSKDWCVSVATDDGSGTAFSYTAASGIEDGACADQASP